MVMDGTLTVHDVIAEACRPGGKPLRTLQLKNLLMDRPQWGPRRARDVLQRLAAALGAGPLPPRTTVAWLIDNRVNGARILAWLDAVETTELLPDGFPFTEIAGAAT